MAADRDDLLREYAEHVHALDQLEASPGWERLVDYLRQESGTHRERVLAGALTPEDYRYECGWLAGALAAVEVPARVRARYQTLLDQKAADEATDDEPAYAAVT